MLFANVAQRTSNSYCLYSWIIVQGPIFNFLNDNLWQIRNSLDVQNSRLIAGAKLKGLSVKICQKHVQNKLRRSTAHDQPQIATKFPKEAQISDQSFNKFLQWSMLVFLHFRCTLYTRSLIFKTIFVCEDQKLTGICSHKWVHMSLQSLLKCYCIPENISLISCRQRYQSV